MDGLQEARTINLPNVTLKATRVGDSDHSASKDQSIAKVFGSGTHTYRAADSSMAPTTSSESKAYPDAQGRYIITSRDFVPSK